MKEQVEKVRITIVLTLAPQPPQNPWFERIRLGAAAPAGEPEAGSEGLLERQSENYRYSDLFDLFRQQFLL